MKGKEVVNMTTYLFMNRIKKNCNKWNSRIPNQKKKKKEFQSTAKKVS